MENALFQNFTHWPVTYCPGRFLVYTADLIKELLAAVDTTPFLWLDDVYVTGLLAGKVGNVKHLNFKDISLQVVWLENAHTIRLLNTWKRF